MAKNEESRLTSDRLPWKSHVKSLFQDNGSEPKTSALQSDAATDENAPLCDENVEEETQGDARPPPRKRR